MRLISDFHDYYDCMLKYDEDRTIIFNRETVVKILPRNLYYNSYQYSDLYVGFCGKGYFGLIDFTKETINDVIWSPQKIDEIFQERYDNKSIRQQRWNKLRTHSGAQSYLRAKYKEFAPKENVPIWVRYDSVIILNPRLADYAFQKVVPPAQAYQELRMWISNQAMPEKPLPTVSNSNLIEAKGYNLKTSFRKESSKRRSEQ